MLLWKNTKLWGRKRDLWNYMTCWLVLHLNDVGNKQNTNSMSLCIQYTFYSMNTYIYHIIALCKPPGRPTSPPTQPAPPFSKSAPLVRSPNYTRLNVEALQNSSVWGPQKWKRKNPSRFVSGEHGPHIPCHGWNGILIPTWNGWIFYGFHCRVNIYQSGNHGLFGS